MVDFDRLASVKLKEGFFRMNPGTECSREVPCLCLCLKVICELYANFPAIWSTILFILAIFLNKQKRWVSSGPTAVLWFKSNVDS